MTNVIEGGFGRDNTPARKTAIEVLRERVDELTPDDEFTDALVITFGEDGVGVRTNLNGPAEVNYLLDITKMIMVDIAFTGGEDE